MLSARFWHCSSAADLAASSLGWPTTYMFTPEMVRAKALESGPDTYSFASAVRARSLTNGTVSGANFSADGIGGGPGGGGGGEAGAASDGLGDGAGGGALFGAGTAAFSTAAISFAGPSSSLVK